MVQPDGEPHAPSRDAIFKSQHRLHCHNKNAGSVH
jgi:hypothetical protein